MAEDPVSHNYQAEVERAKADCQAAGISLVGSCGAVRITNLVAYRIGYKLLLKRSPSTRACLKSDMACNISDPEGYADGYIVHLPTGYGCDMLKDAGGANEPVWQPETTPNEVSRNLVDWREPLFDPALMSDGTVPPDGNGEGENGGENAQLDRIEETLAAQGQQISEILSMLHQVEDPLTKAGIVLLNIQRNQGQHYEGIVAIVGEKMTHDSGETGEVIGLAIGLASRKDHNRWPSQRTTP